MDDQLSLVSKSGLPAPDSVVGAAINDKVVMGIYFEYMKRYGAHIEDIREAYANRRDELTEVLRANNVDGKIEINEDTVGFYIKIPPNTSVPIPIYACFVLSESGIVQRVVNIIDVGDNSEAIVAKGCSTIVPEGAHSAITVFRTGRNARLTSVMLHNWAPNINVGSKTYGLVGPGSQYSYYYVKISPVHSIGLGTEIVGLEGSRIDIHEASMAHRNTRLNSLVKVTLKGRNSRALIDSKGVVYEKGYMNVLTGIRAEAPGTSGHIECSGLVMGKGEYRTHPSLETTVQDTMLTHEASIGRISGEQIFYMQTRGLSEEEATKMIVLGFLASTLKGLRGDLRKYLEQSLKQFVGKGF